DDLSSPKYASESELKEAINEFKKILGENGISDNEQDLELHSDSFFNTHKALPNEKPRYILYPTSTEQVSEIAKIAHKYKVPIIPYSGGTSLEGHYIQTRQGITINFSKMDKIIKFNKDDLDIVVEAGVGWQDLNEFLSPYNLMIGVDPGPGAQFGGMTACSCSGTNAFQFGTMKENVIALEVVLADGTIITTRQRPRKTSAGYNLTGLFIGSEGTLGLVTKVTMKLHVKPENESIAAVSFNSIEDASNAVSKLIQRGIKLNAVELLNDEAMKCLNDSKQLTKIYDIKPTLFLKISGASPNIAKEILKQVKEITEKNNAISYTFATDALEKEQIWDARRLILWSTIEYGKKKLGPEAQVIVTDVAVPISDLPQIIKDTQQDLDNSNILATILGHVGDGNFHALLIYTPQTKEKVQSAADRLVERAVSKYDGTCTGEHGVGYGKRKYLEQELGLPTINVMRRLKLALDPLRILNPDKIFKTDPAD
ncbi:hypothetical protein PACTADRAFT_22360, partial [Pachysolen tannophilus NRRL Y-2460]